MKRRHLSAVIIFVWMLAIVTGCSSGKNDPAPKPTADFNFKIINSIPPADVDFTNISKNATAYSWDFGDNTSSIIESPKHTYAKAGTYMVKLTATGPGGTGQAEDQITVGPKMMVIKSLIIDSAVQVANPMYFLATIKYDNNTITLPDYYLPLSNTIFQPVAAWGQLKHGVSLQSTVTISLYYKLPGDPTVYPAGGAAANSFVFKPTDHTLSGNNYPQQIAMTNLYGGAKTKILVGLVWE